ncbi:hypothetical protein D3C74_326740 [compost metagenome]
MVGRHDDVPALGGPRGPRVDRGEDAADARVLDLELGGVLGCVRAVAVTGAVDVVEVEERHVRVLRPEVGDRGLLGLDVRARRDAQVDPVGDDVAVARRRRDRGPGRGRERRDARVDLLEAIEEARVLRVVLARERVVADVVLVRPHAREDRGPARAGHRLGAALAHLGGVARGVQEAVTRRPALHERVEGGGRGRLDLVEPSPVEPDHEGLVRTSSLQHGGFAVGGEGGGRDEERPCCQRPGQCQVCDLAHVQPFSRHGARHGCGVRTSRETHLSRQASL